MFILIIKDIAAVTGLILSLITLFTLLAKRPRAALGKVINQEVNNSMIEIKHEINGNIKEMREEVKNDINSLKSDVEVFKKRVEKSEEID